MKQLKIQIDDVKQDCKFLHWSLKEALKHNRLMKAAISQLKLGDKQPNPSDKDNTTFITESKQSGIPQTINEILEILL